MVGRILDGFAVFSQSPRLVLEGVDELLRDFEIGVKQFITSLGTPPLQRRHRIKMGPGAIEEKRHLSVAIVIEVTCISPIILPGFSVGSNAVP
jgi:hypothetical protein